MKRLLALLFLYALSSQAQTVHQLSDPVKCPSGARHFYSLTNQFSLQGKMVYECLNGNLASYPIVGPDFKELLADGVKAATGTESSYGEVQWSQVGEFLYGRDGSCGIWKFDPFAKSKTLVVRFPSPRCDQLSVGPNDRLLVHMKDASFNLIAVGTFENGKVSQIAVSAPFDQAEWTQGNKASFIYNRHPARFYTPDLTTAVQQDDNHGHSGYFGKFKVSVKNDTLPNGGVGQIGCAGVTPWIPEHALYDETTGKRVLTFGCQWAASSPEQRSMVHFSRSLKDGVWFGTGAWITRFEYDGTKVTAIPLTETKSNFSCGYWAQPRGASDSTGTRVMFDSTRLGGCQTHVFVAVLDGVTPVPSPTPLPTPVPPSNSPVIAITCPVSSVSSLRCSADVSKLPRGDVTMEVVLRDKDGKVVATGKSAVVKLY